MALDADEEILQDFLIEATEILDSLSEQLVELENNPEDKDLLNSIFRGYHTVKGGAGFLGLTALVDVCHIAENVFDRLRNGEQVITPELMDVSLKALDAVNEMFQQVKSGENPEPAAPEVIAALQRYSHHMDDMPDVEDSSDHEEIADEEDSMEDEFDELFETNQQAMTDSAETESNGSNDEMSEAEFDALLDELHGTCAVASTPKNNPVAKVEENSDDAIDEDEFELLLTQLHGSGAPGTDQSKTSPPVAANNDSISEDEFDSLLDELQGSAQDKKETKKAIESKAPVNSEASDSIDDDEFEALLDSLHGKKQAPSKSIESPADAKDTKKAPSKAVTPKAAAAPKAITPTPKTPVPIESKPPKRPSATPAQRVTANTESTVRVDTKRLDDIMNMVGELVLVRNRLISLAQSYSDEKLLKTISNLDIVTGDLQGAVMKTRMQPIKKVFGRFPRVVRDLARNLKKEMTLQLIGEETDLDKNLVEALADPLVHLVRNSVDHGIEMPDVREKKGKDRVGMITLAAAQEGDHIMLSIKDDGGGMDPEVLKRIAVNKGLMDQEAADRLTLTECYNLIFMPGFSTKTEVSDISGRGVGMDVVKTKITSLNGTLLIDSELGVGTTIYIKVPLTLAILPTLMVTIGKQIFAFPLASVSEIFHLNLRKTNVVDGQLTIIVRGKAIPLFYLEKWLINNSHGHEQKTEGHVVIFQVGTKRVGFVVDALLGQEEVVIKPLGVILQGTPGMAGATITSDGSIALILDVPNLLAHYSKR